MQEAVRAEVASLGLMVPDEALRQAVFDMPAFKGPDGRFDRNVFQNVLRNNGLNEQRLLALLRADLGQQQLFAGAKAGVTAPDELVKLVFAFSKETRLADAVTLTFAQAKTPPAPTDAQLHRWYDNHPDLYSTPELRRIKAVVLAPQTVAGDVQVTDDDLKAAYGQRSAEFNAPEKRTIQTVLLSDADKAQALALATQWRGGADWETIKKTASAEGGSPVDLADAAKVEIPDPDLAAAAFATPEGTVPAPVKGVMGWHVLKVVKVTPGANQTFEQVRDQLRPRVVADKAADLIYDRAGKIEDLLSGGTSLDDLPGDLGLAAVTGTMDAKGVTAEGAPAPIPGPPELRKALIEAAFQMKPGDPPHLTQAPAAGATGGQSYFALQVESITPPAPKPFNQVADAVRADWSGDQVRHEQETGAAQILAEVKAGRTLASAAAPFGLTPQRLPPISRGASAGVPAQLVSPIFALKTGEPTMVETPEGFLVAVLAEVKAPDPAADPIGYGQVRDAMSRALGNDVEAVMLAALRDRANPRINASVLDSLTHQND
jgi:peptidyl-prolyl cis-trans isomerase D